MAEFEDDDFHDMIFFDINDVEEVIQHSESSEDEPYCFCGDANDRNMIAFDHPICEYEWRHFNCAGLTADNIPADDWYCPECTKKTSSKKNKKAMLFHFQNIQNDKCASLLSVCSIGSFATHRVPCKASYQTARICRSAG